MTPDSTRQISINRQDAGSVSGMAITALVPQADGSNNASSTSTSKCAIVTTRPHRIELKLLAGKISYTNHNVTLALAMHLLTP